MKPYFIARSSHVYEVTPITKRTVQICVAHDDETAELIASAMNSKHGGPSPEKVNLAQSRRPIDGRPQENTVVS